MKQVRINSEARKLFCVASWSSLNLKATRFCTAPIASVNGHVFSANALVIRRIIRVWMAYAMGADSLHNSGIIPPIKRPLAHVMIRWIVNAAELASAPGFIVNIYQRGHRCKNSLAVETFPFTNSLKYKAQRTLELSNLAAQYGDQLTYCAASSFHR